MATLSSVCALVACRGVPWGELPETPAGGDAVAPSMVCAGDAVPSQAEDAAPTVEAGRYPPSVYEVIESKREAFEACAVTAAWGSGATGHGWLHIAFSITEAGEVQGACVRKPVATGGETAKCVLGELEGLRFGPGKSARVSYPLDLGPVSAPQIEPSEPPVAEPQVVPRF